MEKVRTMQKYKCDYCQKRSVKHVIEKHEKRCYRNPNRFCDYCDNKGYTMVDVADYHTIKVDCPYCKKFDEKMLKEIENRENGIEKKEETLQDVFTI